jgi:hypothetical protein
MISRQLACLALLLGSVTVPLMTPVIAQASTIETIKDGSVVSVLAQYHGNPNEQMLIGRIGNTGLKGNIAPARVSNNSKAKIRYYFTENSTVEVLGKPSNGYIRTRFWVNYNPKASTGAEAQFRQEVLWVHQSNFKKISVNGL